MTPKVRVLVVDDAVVIRRLLTEVLSSDPGIEVVGTAATGAIGLQQISQVNPDLVTLDVEMPGMSGLETLAALRRTHPRLPVIMFSAITERGASATLDALALGASDYVTKPANVANLAAGVQAVRDSLLPKIKALCARVHGTAAPPPARPRVAPVGAARRVDVLAIGVSTGGPNALAELVPQLPADLPVPVVIVQHMPAVFTKLLAERLDAKAAIHVEEAAPGAQLGAGGAWIAPGNFHMQVAREGVRVVVRTNEDPPENSCRPAVDSLFRSVAEVYGAHALAVVLTGMGQDGLRGCEAIRRAGGQIIVQDEASSVVWGMPGAVAGAGLADKVLPLDQLPLDIMRRLRRGRPAARGTQQALAR